MNNLEMALLIKRENLNQADYFQSIAQEACRLNLLTESEFEKLQLQSIQLLAKETERYTGGESSSVKMETAQSICQSIFYTIGIYLKSLPNPDMALPELKQKPLSELHRNGQELIKAQFENARQLFDAVRDNSISTVNCAYNDTIQNGIPGFFSSYNINYGAHDTPASIDYPLCLDKMELVGIEYIYDYLGKLYMENQLCKNFAQQDIHRLLQGYDGQYEDLLINIFKIVLTNALGCILADKNMPQLNIEFAEIEYLQHILGKMPNDQLDKILQDAANRLRNEFNISNVLLQNYISATVKDLAPKLKNALGNNRLESIFISFKEKQPQPLIQYEDGQKIDDELFRTITDEIRECRYISDKILIIQREIHSIADLVDILEGSCIFDDEFFEIFKSLGDTELALLIKKLPTHVIDTDYHFTENEKEWQNRLRCFLEKMGKTKRATVIKLSQKLNLD